MHASPCFSEKNSMYLIYCFIFLGITILGTQLDDTSFYVGFIQ